MKMRWWDSQSVKIKIAVACGLVLVVGVGGIMLMLHSVSTAALDTLARQAFYDSQRAFDSLVAQDVRMMSAVADSLASNDEIREVLESGDKELMLAATRPLLLELEERHAITHLYLIDIGGTVLMRAHKPKESGDVLQRETFRQAQRTGEVASGLELGKTAFALRVVRPMHADDGRLIGYIEIAEEIDHFLNIVTERTDNEVALLLSKERLDRSDWSEMRRLSGQPDDWDLYDDYVLAGSSSEELVASDRLPSVLGMGADTVVVRENGGEVTVSGLVPIFDMSGDEAGALLLVHDVTPFARMLDNARMLTGFSAMLLFAVLGIGTMFMLDSFVFRRLKVLSNRIAGTGEGVLSDDFISSVDASPGDEIDEFQAHLERSYRELWLKSMLLDEASDSIVVHDLDGKILYVNTAACTRYGRTVEEMVGKSLEQVVFSPDAAKNAARYLEYLLAHGQAIFDSEDVNADGRVFPVEVHARMVDLGNRMAIASVVRDLSERHETARLMERFAHYDPLTGLANRRLTHDRLEAALASCRMFGGSVAVALVDLDRLKIINDGLGHGVGDEVIRVVGERLASVVRDCDTAGRIGGDEFILLCADIDAAEAEEIAARVADVVSQPIAVGEHVLQVSVSVGVTVSDGSREGVEDLIREADFAMYSAKRAGGSRYCMYQGGAPNEPRLPLELRQELLGALERSEFTIHYQPLIDAESRTVVAVEALMRWNHPTRGSVSPAEFIPLAEESGAIIALGEWVLRESCAQCAQWQAQGLDLRLAVNLSVYQLLHPGLIDCVQSALTDAGLEAISLDLEITEGLALTSSQAHETLVELRALGVGVSIDDFGVGYSSLGRLRDLPIDTLKIDRSFVWQMEDAPQIAAIVETIISLGRHLGLNTVAEGVETERQLELLSHMSCGHLQGLLFSPAVEADVIPGFVAKLAGDGSKILGRELS